MTIYLFKIIEKRIGVSGFEPPTSRTPSERASQAAPHPDMIVLIEFKDLY